MGLTGGVGSGKSTVADALASRGAVVIDADAVARDLLQPGTIAHAAVSARFGREFIRSDGSVDRRALGRLVFSDEDSLADLNSIMHPLVRDVIQQQVNAERKTEHIVVLMVPLLVESGHYETDVVVVVDCEEEVAIQRAVESRGWTAKDTRKRIAAQATREERRAAADFVIDNSGSREELAKQVDAAWHWILDQQN